MLLLYSEIITPETEMFSQVNSKGIFHSQLLSFWTLSIAQYCLQNMNSQKLDPFTFQNRKFGR